MKYNIVFTVAMAGLTFAGFIAPSGVKDMWGYITAIYGLTAVVLVWVDKGRANGVKPLEVDSVAALTLSTVRNAMLPVLCQRSFLRAGVVGQYTRIEERTTSAALPPAVRSSALAYDANGNLIDDGQQTYRYDGQNRLIGVESAASATSSVKAEFFYDGRNRCVLRRYYTRGSQGPWVLEPAASLVLTYDTSWNLLAERTLDGRTAGAYVHGRRTDEIIRASLSGTLYPLADGLGSTVALTDRHGRVTQRYRYAVYGKPTILTADFRPLSSGASHFRLLFTGREWLAQVGLNDHRYRCQTPDCGRWLTTDPIRFDAQDVNIYRYVKNSIADFQDPNGLELIILNATTAVAGAGHVGFIVGTPGNYTYYSYAPGPGSGPANNLTAVRLTNTTNEQSAVAAANVIRATTGTAAYDRSFVVNTSSAQDAAAVNAAEGFRNTTYHIDDHNCLHMVKAAASAASIPVENAIIPNNWYETNATTPAVGARPPLPRTPRNCP